MIHAFAPLPTRSLAYALTLTTRAQQRGLTERCLSYLHTTRPLTSTHRTLAPPFARTVGQARAETYAEPHRDVGRERLHGYQRRRFQRELGHPPRAHGWQRDLRGGDGPTRGVHRGQSVQDVLPNWHVLPQLHDDLVGCAGGRTGRLGRRLVQGNTERP